MTTKFFPVCEPFLAGNDKKYAFDAINTGWISSAGKYIHAFEEAFASYLGAKHAIAVSNGTVALHLALVALDIKKGDEVIIPDFTMIASAFAVAYTGAVPVFVDAEPITWNIDAAKIEEKITERTKAIMPVHIYGHPCNMDAINKIAKKYKLKVVEDAAEVHGAEYKGKKCGNLGDIAAFSFFANKVATTGEGGMVVTNDDELAEKCRYYKNLCFPINNSRTYLHDDIGFNYRMSNIHAAIGLAQVEKLDFYIERRRLNNGYYRDFLTDVSGISFQPELKDNLNVYWMNALTIDEDKFGVNRDVLMALLKEQGIDSRLFFKGMHKQPSLINFGCSKNDDYPVSIMLENTGLYLPSGSGLEIDDIKFICKKITKIHERFK